MVYDICGLFLYLLDLLLNARYQNWQYNHYLIFMDLNLCRLNSLDHFLTRKQDTTICLNYPFRMKYYAERVLFGMCTAFII